MRSWVRWVAAALLAGCGGGGSSGTTQQQPPVVTSDGGTGGTGAPTDGGAGTGPGTGAGTGTDGGTVGSTGGAPEPPLKPGVAFGDWTFWSSDQGLPPRVEDVSADEGGNVYVAARGAVFAKAKADGAFRRFDAANAGLTKNCYIADPAKHDEFINVATPPIPLSMCPVISVAGSTPGKAVIGFKGVGTDQDKDAPWALRSGGADVVTFDGASLSRERHVFIAGPPGTVCEQHVCNTLEAGCTRGIECPCGILPDGSRDYKRENGRLVCYPWGTFTDGRLKSRQVQRVVVNHRKGTVGHGDAMFGATHGSFSVLVANPEQRGWTDVTKGDPAWADAKYVFEHQHPANVDPVTNQFLSGDAWALAVDPRSGVPWFANQHRATSIPKYATMLQPFYDPDVWEPWWGNMTGHESGYLTFWVSASAPSEMDATQSMSFCDDGTLWVGSLTRGLARVSVSPTEGTVNGVRHVSLPPEFFNRVYAVACDPDGTVWVGSEVNGVLRYDPSSDTWRHGASLFPAGVPELAWSAPVRSIQIDRWSSPRVVYFAHHDWKKKQKDGTFVAQPGGVTAYAGK